MKKLSEMSYKEFGMLRFLDFFPRTEAYMRDDEGGLETGIGLACFEGYPLTGFASPVEAKNQTAEINLDFDNGIPEREGHAFLQGLGLKLCRGMSASEIKNVLEAPEQDEPRWLRFIIGKSWPYYLGCLVAEKGLCR